MDRIIKVKGTGSMKLVPDTVSFDINMRLTLPEYAATVTASTESINAFGSAIEKEGFDRSALKTVSFDVSPKYDYVSGANGNSERKFVGYECSHNLKFDLPRENPKLLSAFLTVLTKFDFGFSFRFTVKDADSVKNSLITAAVADATEKAKVLAAAAGVKLLAPAEINYSCAEIEVRGRAMMMTEFADGARVRSANSISVDLNAEDINVSDTVTIVWTIA